MESYRYGVGRITYEVVSGGIEAGETAEQAAVKELRQEAGITAGKMTSLGAFDPFTSVVVCPAYLYLAEDLTFGDQELEGTEQIEVIKVPFAEAYRMVMDSEITHGASVAVILKAWQYTQV